MSGATMTRVPCTSVTMTFEPSAIATPSVGVVMGSASDWPTMSKAVEVLEHFRVGYEARVVSAHRMPDEMFAYAEAAGDRGLRAIIAGAGGAAHLPGMLAAKTLVPVLETADCFELVVAGGMGGARSTYSYGVCEPVSRLIES